MGKPHTKLSKKKLSYTPEELLKLRSHVHPSIYKFIAPDLSLTNYICPVQSYSNLMNCRWSKQFADLERHFRQDHYCSILLKESTIEIKYTNFNHINRLTTIKDDEERLYLVAARYHIDEILYFHVLSLRDKYEIRHYKVKVGDDIFVNSCTCGAYVRVPIKRILGSMTHIRISFELL